VSAVCFTVKVLLTVCAYDLVVADSNNCVAIILRRTTFPIFSQIEHQRYGSVNLLFQTLSEDSSFLLLLAYQRIRGFAFMGYINPRLID